MFRNTIKVLNNDDCIHVHSPLVIFKFIYLGAGVLPAVMVVMGMPARAHCTNVALTYTIITKFATGSIYIHDCPGQPNIPIWMVVFGTIFLLSLIVNIVKHFHCRFRKPNVKQFFHNLGLLIEALLHIFLVAFQIVGSYWVYGYLREYSSKESTENPLQCCHPLMFKFAVTSVAITMIYAVLISLLTIIYGLLCIPKTLRSIVNILRHGIDYC